eukprot:85819-Amorphochlora_amoeboformis.AAC.1
MSLTYFSPTQHSTAYELSPVPIDPRLPTNPRRSPCDVICDMIVDTPFNYATRSAIPPTPLEKAPSPPAQTGAMVPHPPVSSNMPPPPPPAPVFLVPETKIRIPPDQKQQPNVVQTPRNIAPKPNMRLRGRGALLSAIRKGKSLKRSKARGSAVKFSSQTLQREKHVQHGRPQR